MQRFSSILSAREKRLLGISVGLYALAVFTPALTFERGFGMGGNNWGWQCLVFGPIAIFASLVHLLKETPSQLVTPLAWLANPLYWLSMAFFINHDYRRASMLGLLATGFALLTLAFYYAEPSHFRHPHLGFYCWVASILSLSIGALTLQLQKSGKQI